MGGSSPRSTPTAVLEDWPSTRPSFLSRFSLRSRAVRPIADFHIVCAEPHRKYAAGDHVEGHIVLVVVKPIRITHLTVLLHGYVRVYKSPNGANEPSFNPVDAGSGRFKYVGNGQASLFQDGQVLCADGRLEPGKYKFGFDLLFPDHGLPSSIDVCLALCPRFARSHADPVAVRARNHLLHDPSHPDPADNVPHADVRPQDLPCRTRRH